MDQKQIILKNISFLSIYPEFINAYLNFGIFRSARNNKSLKLNTLCLRNYATDKQKTVDDKPYGGGEGMVLKCEPLEKAINSFNKRPRIVLPSPKGALWDQKKASQYMHHYEHILFICPRFSGIDQRIIDLYVDEEISLGDYIISGGELASLVIADSIVRHLPKALGNEESAFYDSFSAGLEGKLEYPLYTRPSLFKNLKVPEELISGNHEKIKTWKHEQSILQTSRKRPDLLK